MKNWLQSIIHYFRTLFVIVEFDARKLWHDPSELFFRSLQPALWLLIFGQVLANSQMFLTTQLPYIDFLTPGILAQSVLFVAIFNGIAVIWERDLGISHKLMVAPIPRSAIVIGKGLGSGIRALSQLIIIYFLAIALKVNIDWSINSLALVTIYILLGASLFSTFSLVIACIVKTRERFMGIGQILTMPLFFASNAIYPVAAMPTWLQTVAHSNPLTYEVDALRTVMLVGSESAYGLGVDFLFMLVVTAVLTVLGTLLYPQLAR